MANSKKKNRKKRTRIPTIAQADGDSRAVLKSLRGEDPLKKNVKFYVDKELSDRFKTACEEHGYSIGGTIDLYMARFLRLLYPPKS